MEFTTVHLMRHGEVDNPQGVLYGRLPSFGLTPLGKEMAQEVADYLVAERRDITHVIASPLLRAQQTALPTARAYGLPIEIDPRLMEAGNDFEGKQINKNRWALLHPRNCIIDSYDVGQHECQTEVYRGAHRSPWASAPAAMQASSQTTMRKMLRLLM